MSGAFQITSKPGKAAQALPKESVNATLTLACRILSSVWRHLSEERVCKNKDDLTCRQLHSKRLHDKHGFYQMSAKLNKENDWIFTSAKTFRWLLRFAFKLRKRQEKRKKRETLLLKYILKNRLKLLVFYEKIK